MPEEEEEAAVWLKVESLTPERRSLFVRADAVVEVELLDGSLWVQTARGGWSVVHTREENVLEFAKVARALNLGSVA